MANRTKLTRRTDIDRVKSNKAAGDRIIAKLSEHDDALDSLIPSGYGTAGAKAQTNFYSVRGVTTSNMASFTGVSTTFDGLTLVAGDRILVAAQSTGSQNGIYVVGTVATGTATWTRAVDMPAAAVIPGEILVAVDAGTVGANRIYKSTVAGPITVATTAITWQLLVQGANGTVDGSNVTLGEVGATTGFLPVMYVIDVPDGNTVLDALTLDATYGKTLFLDAFVIKGTTTGGASDAVQVTTDSGGTTAVTSSLALNTIAVGGIVRTTSIANNTFAAGAHIYVKRTKTTANNCTLVMTGYRVA